MNNYCRNCGEKLEENAESCPKCGAEVIEKRVDSETEKEEIEECEKKESSFSQVIFILFVLLILTYFLSRVSSIFSFLLPIIFIIFVVSLVYGRITLKPSKNFTGSFDVTGIFNAFVVCFFICGIAFFIAILVIDKSCG